MGDANFLVNNRDRTLTSNPSGDSFFLYSPHVCSVALYLLSSVKHQMRARNEAPSLEIIVIDPQGVDDALSATTKGI